MCMFLTECLCEYGIFNNLHECVSLRVYIPLRMYISMCICVYVRVCVSGRAYGPSHLNESPMRMTTAIWGWSLCRRRPRSVYKLVNCHWWTDIQQRLHQRSLLNSIHLKRSPLILLQRESDCV